MNKTTVYRSLGKAKLSRTRGLGQLDGQNFIAVVFWSMRRYELGVSLVATNNYEIRMQKSSSTMFYFSQTFFKATRAFSVQETQKWTLNSQCSARINLPYRITEC